MKLTKAQIEVLDLLAVKPRQTSATTHHDVVSGRCVATLIQQGLARRDRGYVYITDAGSQALATKLEE